MLRRSLRPVLSIAASSLASNKKSRQELSFPAGFLTWLGSISRTPTKIPSGGLSKWLQDHFVAQAFQPADQGSADSVHVDPVKVVRTEFPVVFLTLVAQ
jgi:hypothetical protein